MQYRSGENVQQYYRARRFFCISGEWFFSTRENLQVGPFAYRDEAEIQLMIFLRHINEGGIYADPQDAIHFFPQAWQFSSISCLQ